MSDNLKASQVDDRRRLVLPECFPAGCAVLVHQLDDETVIVRRAKKDKTLRVVVLSDVDSKNASG